MAIILYLVKGRFCPGHACTIAMAEPEVEPMFAGEEAASDEDFNIVEAVLASSSEEDIMACDCEDTVSKADAPTFKIGDSFTTFDELERSLKEFESFHYVKFWKREARTVKAAEKRVNRYINPRLKYYQLKYACIHGGQVFRPKGKGHKSTS